MQYMKDNGARKGTRIAYLYLDSPAGREGNPMMEAVAAKEGYVLRMIPVQRPGYDIEAPVAQAGGDFKADWAVASLFGRPAAASIREFKRAGFPMHRVISFVYGAGEPDVEAAGWDTAQGYLGLQFTTVGRNHPVIQELIRMFRDEGKDVPTHVGSAYYNRGVLTGALMAEGVRLAIQNHGLPLTGEKVKKGYEAIRNFDLQGLAPALTFTPQDHEGGGSVRVYQVKGREWVPVTGWVRGHREEAMALVKKANAK